MDETKPFVGSPADVRRWAENRRIANAVEVRDLRTAWNSPGRSFMAACELLALYAAVNGWPPPLDPRREREADEARNRFVALRGRSRS